LYLRAALLKNVDLFDRITMRAAGKMTGLELGVVLEQSLIGLSRGMFCIFDRFDQPSWMKQGK
jgi:hypothetical protein